MKNKKINIILSLVVVLTTVSFIASNVSAFSLSNVLSDANDFAGGALNGDGQGLLDAGTVESIFGEFMDLIFTIGNLVIFCAAAFLGLKYIWSGVEGKTSVKESAMNMLFGVIFFYSAQGLYDVFSKLIIGIATKDSFEAMTSDIWANVAYVVKMFAVLGFVAVGVKYMMTSADVKADIKKQLFPVVLGLIIVFCLTEVLELIVSISGDMVGGNGTNNVENITPGTTDINVMKMVNVVVSNAGLILQFLAVGAVVFTGLRYMMSSADTRADIKTQTVILLAGAIMAFGAIEIIKMIQKTGQEVLK